MGILIGVFRVTQAALIGYILARAAQGFYILGKDVIKAARGEPRWPGRCC